MLFKSPFAKFMEQAIDLAKIALQEEQWPVGAVIVRYTDPNIHSLKINKTHQIISTAYNQMEKLQDPTAHAEILAAKQACELLQQKYLSDCILFVTLQPCKMCFYTMLAYRIHKIVYGANANFNDMFNINQQCNKLIYDSKKIIQDALYENQCKQLLQEFGQKIRNKNKS